MGRPAQAVLRPGLQPGPLAWGGWQKLPDDARTIYAALRQAALGTRRAGKRVLLEAIGKARAEARGEPWSGKPEGHRDLLAPIFTDLESLGFIECHDWGQLLPMRVIVNPLPRPTLVQISALESAWIEQFTRRQEAAEFVTWWRAEFARRNDGASYRVLRGRDPHTVKLLLRGHSLDWLKRHAIHFFRMFDEPHTLASFSDRINEVATSFAAADKARL